MATPNIETMIWLALRGRVESLVLSPSLPVLWPGQGASLPAGRCIEVFHLVNRPVRPFLASGDPHERMGILQLSVVSPISSSEHYETVVREIAGDIADHFPPDLRMTYGDVTVRVSEAPEVAQSYKDQGRNRYITPVSVRWYCFA